MKLLLLSVLAFIVCGSADAKKADILLDCNVQGDDQQAIVSRTDSGLELKELNNHGSMSSRSLSEGEWNSKDIALKGQNGAKYHLYYSKEDKAWMYEQFSPFNHNRTDVGFADCAK